MDKQKGQKEIDPWKWKLFNNLLDVVLIVISIIVGEMISKRFFDGSMITNILIMCLGVALLSPVKLLIGNVVDKSEFLRKFFEKQDKR